MANTVENTFKKISNTLEHIFGTSSGTKQPQTNNGSGKASALEMYGQQARQYHLNRNEWRKDLQYTKPFVSAEYMIQTEFKINGGSDEPSASQLTNEVDKYDNKIKKLEEKKARAEARLVKKNSK